MGAPYDQIPGVDSGNSFHPAIRQAMADSPEMATLLGNLIPKGYRAYAMADDPTKYPVGISTFIAGTAEGWTLGNGQSFHQVLTSRAKQYDGGTLQLAIPYSDDTLPLLWRIWEANTAVWGPWYSIASTSALALKAPINSPTFTGTVAGITKAMVGLGNVDNTSDLTKLADYIPKWKPSTAYASGQQVVTPFNRVASSKSARTSGATWDFTESANWNIGDEQMVFFNAGFAWSSNWQPWDAGPFSIANSAGPAESQFSPGVNFAVAGAYSGSIKFLEPGIYDMTWNINPNGNPGSRQYTINMVDNSQWSTTAPDSTWQRLGTIYVPDNSTIWESSVTAPNIRVPKANLTIRTSGQQQNATTNYASIKVTRKARI